MPQASQKSVMGRGKQVLAWLSAKLTWIGTE